MRGVLRVESDDGAREKGEEPDEAEEENQEREGLDGGEQGVDGLRANGLVGSS